jgi:hypothetical protein
MRYSSRLLSEFYTRVWDQESHKCFDSKRVKSVGILNFKVSAILKKFVVGIRKKCVGAQFRPKNRKALLSRPHVSMPFSIMTIRPGGDPPSSTRRTKRSYSGVHPSGALWNDAALAKSSIKRHKSTSWSAVTGSRNFGIGDLGSDHELPSTRTPESTAPDASINDPALR